MKIISVISLLFYISNSIAQELDVIDLPINKETNTVEFKNIEQTTGSASVLFKRAKEWIKLQYFSGRERSLAGKYEDMAIEDTEENKIIIKAGFRVKVEDGGLLSSCGAKVFTIVYTFKIYLKDQRYKYEFSDFVLQEDKRGSESTLYVPTQYIDITTTTIKDPEVIETPIEDIYPLEKVKSCKSRYLKVLKEIQEEINKRILNLKDHMKKSDDW